MKIVLATPIYPPELGGPATYTKEIAARLAGTHEITVVAYTDAPQPVLGTRLIAVSKRYLLPVRLAAYCLALWRATKGADLIYAQNAVAAGLPAALVSFLRRKPYAVKFVGDEAWEREVLHRRTSKTWEEFLDHPTGNWYTQLLMAVQSFVLRHAARVTTPSDYLTEELIEHYGVSRSQAAVNYNAADQTEVLPFEVARDPHQIATTARLIPLKQIDGIIEALSIVRKKHSEATLVIGGDGPERPRLERLVSELGLKEHVTFLGKISRAETWRLRKKSAVYVINSTHEGLPITVLTSFAAGIPVVATEVPGTTEAVYHEKSGLLVPPENPQALAAAIMRVLTDEELARTLIAGGYAMLQEKFSWDTHLRTLEGMFQSMLSKPRHKAPHA